MFASLCPNPHWLSSLSFTRSSPSPVPQPCPSTSWFLVPLGLCRCRELHSGCRHLCAQFTHAFSLVLCATQGPPRPSVWLVLCPQVEKLFPLATSTPTTRSAPITTITTNITASTLSLSLSLRFSKCLVRYCIEFLQ